MRVRPFLVSLSLVVACSNEGENTGMVFDAALDASFRHDSGSDEVADGDASQKTDASTPDGSAEEMDASTDDMDATIPPMDASDGAMDSGADSSLSHHDASDGSSGHRDAAMDDDEEDGGNEEDGGDAGDPDDGPPFHYDQIDPEIDCEALFELRAFNPDKTSEGFIVGENVDNTYECFDFEVPYDGKMQGLQIVPIIDDVRVVNSWRLYEASGSTTGKQYWNCTGQHPAAQLIAGWAPGRGTTLMPRGVGLKLPQKSTGKFTLEIHYNNAAHASGVKDRSGAKVCATSKLRQNEAAVHWLGTEAIAGPIAQGTCTVPKSATIITSWPHMHALGNHMKVELKKKSGGANIVMLDKAFSFDDERAYDTPMQVVPGDKIFTTCTYDGFAIFGIEADREQCYNYVLAYPAGALQNGVSLTGTSATCLQ